MKTYRTPASQKIYEREMKKMKGETACRLCAKPFLRELGNFAIVHNDFPYDAVSDVNDILIHREHKSSLNMTDLIELEQVKKQLSDETYYDLILENLYFKASVKDHWHIQLIRRNEAHEPEIDDEEKAEILRLQQMEMT